MTAICLMISWRFICNAFGITTDDLVLGGRYNNLQDLIKLPNPRGKELEQQGVTEQEAVQMVVTEPDSTAENVEDVLLII